MNGIIYRLKNVDKRKRRFISMLTAMFMVFTFCGDSLKVFAEIAGNIEGIENVTGNTDKNAELLDCPDADEKYLGMAGDFTIFVKEKFTIPKDSADIEGRLAAGGGIENNRPANETYTIGNRYLGKGATVLVGGGQIDRITTGAAEGSERRIFVVSSDTDITYETGIRTENTYISDDIIDYDREFQKLASKSNSISKYETTGDIEITNYSAVFTGKDPVLNVFNITSEQMDILNDLYYVEIRVPGDAFDSYVIFNVEGKVIEMPHYSVAFIDEVHDGPLTVEQDTGSSENARLCGHILYNLYEAEDVKYTGSIQGSTLAVNANVSGEPNGHVSGATIAKSAEGFGIQAGSATFNPPKKIIEVVPELKTVSISKTDIAGSKEIPGAKLELTLTEPYNNPADSLIGFVNGNILPGKDGNSVTWTSTDKPTEFTGLPDGKYILEESVAPDGYTVTGSIKFEIRDGIVGRTDSSVPALGDGVVDSETNTVTMKDELSKLVISKQKITEGTSEELPGAELTVAYKGTGSFSGVKQGEDSGASITVSGNTVKWTSGTKPAVIEGLPDGEYTLTEVRAPEGFEKAETIEFILRDGKTYVKNGETVSSVASDKVIMIDAETPKLSEIVISKQSVSGAAEVPGAHLKITAEGNADLSRVTSDAEITVKDNTIAWVSGNTPVTVIGLPDGTYTLEESVAPDGYTVTGAVTFTVEEGLVKDSTGNTVKMIDEYSEVLVSKKDINGTEELDGATLEIKLVEATKTPGANLLDTKVGGGAKEIYVGSDRISFVTDAKTPAKLTMLPDGKYTLTEITAPDGYTVNEETIEFEVKDGELVSGKEVVMLDAPSKVTISKQKVSGSELPGAELTLTIAEDKSLENVKSNVDIKISGKSISWKSKTVPAVLEGVPDGTYTLTEDKAPLGFLTAESITFTVENGEVVEYADGTVIMTDLEEPDLCTVTISKQSVSGSAEVPGAHLTITAIDTTPDFSDIISEADITVEKNKISFVSGTSPVIISGLPDGKYKLEESIAPDGYTVTDSIEFNVENGKVKENDSNEIIMKDLASEITVSKKDINKSEELPGAKLTIKLTEASKDKNATLTSVKVGGGAVSPSIKATEISFVSGSEPAIITQLPDGKYELRETKSPDGYTINEETVKFEIIEGVLADLDEVTMLDKQTEVKISKTDITHEKEVPGATLKLTIDQGYKTSGANLRAFVNEQIKAVDESAVSVTWVSGNEPVVFSGLPDGAYTLEESVAPDGYTITGSVKFTVIDGVVTSAVSTVPRPEDSRVDTGSSSVIMVDVLSKVNISKTDISGNEIEGAKLSLKLVKAINKGADLLSVSVGGGASDVVTESSVIEFVSGAKPAIIEGLPDGNYTLTETQAPAGYQIAESMPFGIRNGKVVGTEDDTIVMIDEIIVTTTPVTTTTPVPTTTTVTTTTTPTPTTTTVTTTTTPVPTTTTVTTTTTPTPTTTTVRTTTTPTPTTTKVTTTLVAPEISVSMTTQKVPVTITDKTEKPEGPEFTVSETSQVSEITETEETITVTTTEETTELTTTEETTESTTESTTQSTTTTTVKKTSSTPSTGDSANAAAAMFVMAGALSVIGFVRKRKI